MTPTQDEGKLIAALHEAKQGGLADLSTGIQVAQVKPPRLPVAFRLGTALTRRETPQLALKHRQNKNQRQRIIVFVGSPLSASSVSLVKVRVHPREQHAAPA